MLVRPGSQVKQQTGSGRHHSLLCGREPRPHRQQALGPLAFTYSWPSDHLLALPLPALSTPPFATIFRPSDLQRAIDCRPFMLAIGLLVTIWGIADVARAGPVRCPPPPSTAPSSAFPPPSVSSSPDTNPSATTSAPRQSATYSWPEVPYSWPTTRRFSYTGVPKPRPTGRAFGIYFGMPIEGEHINSFYGLRADGYIGYYLWPSSGV